MHAIQADRITKAFDSLTALRGVDFKIAPGEIVGLVGPNGAGKTTLIRILNGVLAPTSGTATVLGLNPQADGRALRRKTGILPEFNSLYEDLSAMENLLFAGAMYGLEGPSLAGRAGEGKVGKVVDLHHDGVSLSIHHVALGQDPTSDKR